MSFGQLSVGWNYGSGVPASQEVINTALLVCAHLQFAGAIQVEAFPETKGGILVSGYHDADTIDVLCRVDSLFNIFHEEGDREIFEKEGVGFLFVANYVQGLPWLSSRSFDLFTPSTSVTRKTSLRAWRTKSQMMDVRLSIPPARLAHPTANARTFAHSTTPAFQATRQSSSALIPRHSPTATH